MRTKTKRLINPNDYSLFEVFDLVNFINLIKNDAQVIRKKADCAALLELIPFKKSFYTFEGKGIKGGYNSDLDVQPVGITTPDEVWQRRKEINLKIKQIQKI